MFFNVQTFVGNIGDWARQVTTAINSLRDGKINSTGSVTLRTSQTTTTVSDIRCSPNSVVVLTPTVAAAAADIAVTYVVPGDKQFIITHASDSDTKTFKYAILG